MHREAVFDTPEDAAAAGAAGETLDVDVSGDGRWAVVVRRDRQALGFTLCKSVPRGWVFEAEGELTPPRGSSRSAWISLVDFDVEDGPNLGVKLTWGAAPPGMMRAEVRCGGEVLVVPVHEESYWIVRWQVSDDDEEPEVVRFTGP